MLVETADQGCADIADWLANSVRHMSRRGDIAECSMTAAQRYIAHVSRGRCRFSVMDPNGFVDFSACEFKLGATPIRFLHWDSTTLCEKVTDRPVGRQDVALHCVLRGELDVVQDGEHVTVRAGQVMIKAAGGHTIKRWRGVCEMLIVFVMRDALSRIVSDSQQPGADGVPGLAPLTVVDMSRVATLARYIATIVADLVGTSPSFRDPEVALLAERTLHLLFLRSLFPIAHDERGDVPDIVPFYIRRAESYIRANMHKKLNLRELADVAGVSQRTIQYGFSTYRQRSPTRYLKDLRLKSARDRLLGSRGASPRIGELATNLGYQSVSQFSRDYRTYFGESPKQTLSGAH